MDFFAVKNNKIPKLTDMLLEAEYSLSQQDYRSVLYKTAKLEMEIYKVKNTADHLLEQIKEITTSDERNRAIITKLKSDYRELFEKYNQNKAEYGEINSLSFDDNH